MRPKDRDLNLDKIRSLAHLEKLAESCTNCELYKNGNLVFGEGKKTFSVVMVGEQPGNDEEIKRRPFVGPAGKLLKKILEEIEIEPSKIYYTNAVKHFRYQPLGKRRIHQKPKTSQIRACRIWLDQELKLIKPEIIVCLGKTAAESVLQTAVSINKQHGKIVESEYGKTLITYHPSFFLRQIDKKSRDELIKSFKKDLQKIKQHF